MISKPTILLSFFLYSGPSAPNGLGLVNLTVSKLSAIGAYEHGDFHIEPPKRRSLGEAYSYPPGVSLAPSQGLPAHGQAHGAAAAADLR